MGARSRDWRAVRWAAAKEKQRQCLLRTRRDGNEKKKAAKHRVASAIGFPHETSEAFRVGRGGAAERAKRSARQSDERCEACDDEQSNPVMSREGHFAHFFAREKVGRVGTRNTLIRFAVGKPPSSLPPLSRCDSSRKRHRISLSGKAARAIVFPLRGGSHWRVDGNHCSSCDSDQMRKISAHTSSAFSSASGSVALPSA